MKKVDLHIHTVPTVRDSFFEFSLERFAECVSDAGLDAVAITNHDMFDIDQYRQVRDRLSPTAVFPGIEVSLVCGHVLVIADCNSVDDLDQRAAQVSQRINSPLDTLSLDDFESIFGDMNRYLVVPHYDKGPAVKGPALERISKYAPCGEVDSAKKFIRVSKDSSALTPVLFSDARISTELTALPPRHTFVDCGDVTLSALKSCFVDRGKVALSPADGNSLIQVFDDGQMISTGLNVLLGERSSGKTFTLDRVSASNENVKYIQQFSLVQHDSKADEKEFERNLQRDRSLQMEKYLSGFKVVINDVMRIDQRANEKAVEDFVDTLLKSAEEADKRDAYSKVALFDASEFRPGTDQLLSELIQSVRQLIENIEYKDVIAKHVDRASLKRLARELIQILWDGALARKKQQLVNALVSDIKTQLKVRTSATQVSDIDLYHLSLDKKKVERFNEIVRRLRRPAVIHEESVQGFRVVAKKGQYAGAGEVKKASGVMAGFQDAFNDYDRPYDYLQKLKAIEALKPSELYKLFAKISYSILNRDGFEVSGGERSEFRLLHEIADAQNYDFLLVDEPESSFDNIFLKSDVNQILREISQSMPVVVVTHNSTVGASIHPDYVMYATKELVAGDVRYKLYSGYSTDHELRSRDGTSINNCQVMLDSLEAGREAYDDRRRGYEALED